MSYPVNPMQLIQMIKQGQNPQQLLMNILSQNQNQPMYQNLLTLAKENKTGEIEKIARNIAKEKGIDFDQAFNSFKQQLGAFK